MVTQDIIIKGGVYINYISLIRVVSFAENQIEDRRGNLIYKELCDQCL